MKSLYPAIVLAFATSLSACSDDALSSNNTPTPDTGTSDVAFDTSPTTDAGEDASVPEADIGADTGLDMAQGCSLPAPLIAGTDATNALAHSPARCGMPEYAWLTSNDLGVPTFIDSTRTIPASVFTSLAEQENIELPRPPEYDVVVRVFEYQTQDRGQLVTATSMIAQPRDIDAPQDVLLLLHGTSGFKDGCGPSGDLGGQALAALISSMGYTVIAPDYIGMKSAGEPTGFPHPYLVGEATAIASLDAVRAGMRVADAEGQCLRPRVMTMGFSQGGHATLWVDRLAPYYARELELVGGAAGTPPADLVTAIQRALTSYVPATSNTIASLSTMASWYGFGDRLDEVFLAPLDQTVPAALAAECNPSDVVGSDPTVEAIFQSTLRDAASGGTFAELSPWGCMTAENSLTDTATPRLDSYSDSYGVLFVLGEADELVLPEIERAAFDRLCAEQSMPLEYLECAGADHVEGNLWALPEMLDFLDARADGAPIPAEDACVRATPVRCRGTLD